MLAIRICFLLPLLVFVLLAVDCHAIQRKRAVVFGDKTLDKRNIGGQLKDMYLSKFTQNYFCTDTFRLVPVDPETGHMLLKGLRKRSFIDDFFGHSHSTEHGECRNPTWVLPPGWTQPIPKTQFEAQYPWAYVDDRGRIRLKEDYRDWLEQQSQARLAGATNPSEGGSTMPGGPNGAVVPDGGVGYVPPSYLHVASGMGTTSGFGQSDFGNGVTAGNAAHV